MNRELLEQEFDPSLIKHRKGNFGVLGYLEAHVIIQRLNEAFDGKWSFTILKHEIMEETDEVLVLCELKAEDIVKTQFGSSRITRVKESGKIVSLADDLKAAATDALKKSATYFGVALYLYQKSNNNPRQHQESRSKPENASAAKDKGKGHPPESRKGKSERASHPVGEGSNVCRPQFNVVEGDQPQGDEASATKGNGKGNAQLSLPQYNYIKSLGKQLGYDYGRLRKLSIDAYGVEVERLSKSQASKFLKYLQCGEPLPSCQNAR